MKVYNVHIWRTQEARLQLTEEDVKGENPVDRAWEIVEDYDFIYLDQDGYSETVDISE